MGSQASFSRGGSATATFTGTFTATGLTSGASPTVTKTGANAWQVGIPVGVNGTNGATGATGSIGPSGPQGSVGLTGSQGPIGLTGPAGSNGATGSQGTAGTNGSNGTNGATGSAGSTGATGSAGAAAIATKAILTTDANGLVTWTYSGTPFTSGYSPSVTATAAGPVGSTDLLNAQVQGTPSYTSCVVKVNRTSQTTVALIGLTILAIPGSVGVQVVHCHAT